MTGFCVFARIWRIGSLAIVRIHNSNPIASKKPVIPLDYLTHTHYDIV
jgi:hypothetical protein